MATIYGLFTDQLCWYVGKTQQHLKRREQKHRSGARCGSSLIPKEYAWEMRKLEDCSVHDGPARERHWYDALHPLYNQEVPNRNRKEYMKSWRAANLEKLRNEARARYARKKLIQEQNANV